MGDNVPAPGRPLSRGPHGEEMVQVIPQPCAPRDGAPGVYLEAPAQRLIGDEPLRVADALRAAWCEANGGAPSPGSVVQRFRKEPVEVDMIRWDGSDEALGAIRSQPGASPYLCSGSGEKCKGALVIWTAKGMAHAHVFPGDWVAIEPDGSGVYPVAADVLAQTYVPAEDPQGSIQ